MNVEFKFNLADRVEIIETKRAGNVVSLHLDRDGIKLTQVEWADDKGEFKDRYFRENELRLASN